MHICVYKSLWGMTGARAAQVERIAAAGYDGIETAVPAEDAEGFFRDLERHRLGFVAMAFTDSVPALEEALLRARDAGARFVNVHSGRDCMTFDEGCAFFEGALHAEERAGIRAGHETHRGRLLYNPWVTAAYLRKFPDLRITADFSHWTNVCERLLPDQEENLALACERALHLHARVGDEEGPPVPDPRAPEWQGHVERFELWWDPIIQAHTRRGEPALFVDPEFGPPQYLHTLPFTQAPVADLWEVCLYMADRLRRRWE